VGTTDAQTFQPATVTVAAGDTVVFSNDTSQVHSVTAYQGDIPEGAEYFGSGGSASEKEAREDVTDTLLEEGETFEVTLETPGTYKYFCVPHEQQGMTGAIVVEG